MSFSQKESVYAAVKAFLDEKGINHDDGQVVTLDKDGRKTVIEMISQAAMHGDMQLSDEAKTKYNTIEKMRGYVNGLLSNWLRKDVRLNGGSKYETKNPGSRAGQGDETLKSLKALRGTLSDAAHIAAVDSEIEKRQAEISAAKAKKVEINFDVLPDSIRSMIGK
jgi:hypothetical protein